MPTPTLRWTPRTSSDAMLYSNDGLVERFAQEHGTSLHDAGQQFAGLKQFLFTCAAVPGTHTPPDGVAAMWRLFLTSSKDYRQFCHGYLGRFIDHRTLAAPSRAAYLATRHAAEEVFGPLDEELWPLGDAQASGDDNGTET